MPCDRCNDSNCLGTVLLIDAELKQLDEIKNSLSSRYGDVSFKMTRSPSSGEIFTKFYDLHVLGNK